MQLDHKGLTAFFSTLATESYQASTYAHVRSEVVDVNDLSLAELLRNPHTIFAFP